MRDDHPQVATETDHGKARIATQTAAGIPDAHRMGGEVYRLRVVWSPRRLGIISRGMALVALFTFLTLAFGGIAVEGAAAGRWVIALGAAAIAAWMGSFAWAALRRARR